MIIGIVYFHAMESKSEIAQKFSKKKEISGSDIKKQKDNFIKFCNNIENTIPTIQNLDSLQQFAEAFNTKVFSINEIINDVSSYEQCDINDVIYKIDRAIIKSLGRLYSNIQTKLLKIQNIHDWKILEIEFETIKPVMKLNIERVAAEFDINLYISTTTTSIINALNRLCFDIQDKLQEVNKITDWENLKNDFNEIKPIMELAIQNFEKDMDISPFEIEFMQNSLFRTEEEINVRYKNIKI